jgi:gamma-glutamyltranspeptidase
LKSNVSRDSLHVFLRFFLFKILDAKYIAIPGELKAYWTLHQKYGRLPWAELFKPAVHFARNGFHISNSVFKAISLLKSALQKDIKDFPPLWYAHKSCTLSLI